MFHMGFTTQPAVHDYREAVAAFDSAKYGRFTLGMLNQGVRLIGRGIWYLSIVHTQEDVETAIATAGKILKQL